MDLSKLTPAQRQYMELKNQYKDCIMFFRMWDFYETFYEDAKICSKVLDLALTSRDRNSENPVPMAWVPYHSADKYISRLVKAWYKVAIAEQLGEVRPGQIVKRDVVSIVTPWTFIDEKEDKKYNFIWAIYQNVEENQFHLAWWDFSLGEYYTKSFESIESMLKFLIKIDLAELIMDISFKFKQEVTDYIRNFSRCFISISDVPYDVDKFLTEIFHVQTLGGFWKALQEWRKQSLWLLLNYLKDTQKTSLKNVSKVWYFGTEDEVVFDETTIKNLEILRSSYEWSSKYSLLWVIDQTNTAMWWRMLQNIIINPIRDLQTLNWRFDNISYYNDHQDITNEIISNLKLVTDIPRIMTTLVYRKNIPSIFNRLKISLRNIFHSNTPSFWADVKNPFTESTMDPEINPVWQQWQNSIITKELLRLWLSQNILDKVLDVYYLFESALKDEWFQEDLDYIKDWFDSKIDSLREIAYHSDELLLKYQQELVQFSWLNNLKIRYVQNQWYFIEATKKDSETLEKLTKSDDKYLFMRRQTLKWAERYITPYLEQIQSKIITAKDELSKLEKEVLENLKNKLVEFNHEFSAVCDFIAYLDIFSSFWKYTYENRWIKPNLHQWYELEIKWWRHPVIEYYLPMWEHFIPNDIYSDKEWFLDIITGPNMGWKSTYLRQNAIIILLSHCGLWVPADSAKISLVDGIYARVGSWDILAKNQSTFMTEMIELANILNNSTTKSFIILDELGRWTSTYDWVALAKSIVEYICTKIKCKTLFATHYHELIWLEKKFSVLKNYSVAVYETEHEVVFMKKIVKWWANKSYWIDVAKLAWLPWEILENSRKYLKELESNNWSKGSASTQTLFEIPSKAEDERIKKYNQVKDYLDKIDLNNITPLNAMDILDKLKKL